MVRRTGFRAGAFVLAIALAIPAGAVTKPQLLLVRDSAPDATCDQPVIHGKLYAVPSAIDLEGVVSPLGLQLLAATEELPFENNAVNASSIPTGRYSAFVRTDESKRWMQGKPERAWRLELKGTKHRTAIQFHYGKDKSWSKGCVILVNTSPRPLVCSEGDSPASAVKAVQDYVESITGKADVEILIKIVNSP